MNLVAVLVGRNLRAFWRDRMSVFFSMIAPVVFFALFFIFLRNQVADVIQSAVTGSERDDVLALCDAWLFASVATLASFTTSLGMLTALVEDRVTGRFSDYLVSPIRRWQLGLGYVLSVLIISTLITIIIFSLGQVWAGAHGQPVLAPMTLLLAWAGIGLACLVYSAFNTLMVTFTSTQGSYGGYSIVLGTAMGFISYCYVLPSGLSQIVNTVLSVMPFAQTASVIRKVAMQPAADRLMAIVPEGETRAQAKQALLENIGVNLLVDGHPLSVGTMVAILIGLTVVLSAAVSWRMGRIIR